MTLYFPRNIFHLARLLYVRPETFGPYYVSVSFNDWCLFGYNSVSADFSVFLDVLIDTLLNLDT